MSKQEFILKPPEEHSCQYCDKWNCYKPYQGEVQNWGKCMVKDVPRYMSVMYYSRGCNLHSKLLHREKQVTVSPAFEQISMF